MIIVPGCWAYERIVRLSPGAIVRLTAYRVPAQNGRGMRTRHGTNMPKRRGLQLLRGTETRLDEEDPTPEGETHMPCKRGKGVDTQERRVRNRIRGEPYGDIVHERHWSPLVRRARGGIPRAVTMGLGLVMGRVMRVRGLTILVMVMSQRVVVILMERGRARMGE